MSFRAINEYKIDERSDLMARNEDGCPDAGSGNAFPRGIL